MLNKRQRMIIKDMENSTAFVTAKQLSTKYNVSLRTIRSDINEINTFLQDNNIEFIRIPGQGMQIISNKKISADFNESIRNRDFPYIDENRRIILIMFHFLFSKTPISTIQLCETLDMSKTTMISLIKTVNDYLSDYNLSIIRYQNKGYILSGRLKDIILLIESFIKNEGEETIYNTLILKENNFINEKDLQKLNDTLSLIAGDLSLFITHHYFLSVVLYTLICFNRYNRRQVSSRSKNEDEIIIRLKQYIEDSFSINLNKESQLILKHALNYATDYSSGFNSNDINLMKAIDAMVEYVRSSGMYQISDDETLKIDLRIHIQSAIEALHSGLQRDNPLLDEIRNNYPNEFNLIKSAAQRFSKFYEFSFTEDEIGFITLYFLRSFDKAEKLQETNVMVVCNTGRSASRLLATRLINNIPNIHITSMNSIYNIENDPESLKNVDFVISTIPLNNINKPYIIISPLLQKNEINKVREAIWLSKTEMQSDKPIDEIASSMLEQYQSFENEQNNTIRKYDIDNLIPYNITGIIGEVTMNLITLISKLYPEQIPANCYGNISGIFAHVLMSLPRWQRGEFIQPGNDEELISQYSKQYEIIKEYLKEEAERLGIYIPEAEVITILRYYIY